MKPSAPAAAILFLLPFAQILAQANPHRFEVASVRPSAGVGKAVLQTGPASLTYSHVSLADCLKTAYGVNAAQITGPGWIASDLFDVQARASAPVADDERNLMLQNLLSEQFKLVVRREIRPTKVLVLRAVAGEPKLAHSKGEGPPRIVPTEEEGKLEINAFATSMAELANFLTRPLQAQVEDRTGLDQRYDFHLDLMPFMSAGEPQEVAMGDRVGIINAALRKELGLQLKDETIPMDFLIVDHAEHPVIN